MANDGGAPGKAQVIQHPAVAQKRPQVLLERVFDRWCQFGRDRLARLLLDLDDDLFARADEAQSDSQQQAYFDTMRLLRVDADGLRARFAAAICRPAAAQHATANGAPSAEGVTLEERIDRMSLLDDDALEQRLAVVTMTQRFEAMQNLDVRLVARRIEELNRQAGHGWQVELAPRHFAEAFVEAIAPLELDPQVRLLIFKHFEQQVMEPLVGLFRQINSALLKAGVLPNLDLAREQRSEAPRQQPDTREQPTASGRQAQQAPPRPEPDASDDLMDGHHEPLPGMRHRAALMRRLPALRRHRRFTTHADTDAVLGIRTVLKLLESEDLAALSSFDDDAALERIPDRLDLAALLIAQASQRGRRAPALESVDEDTVNLIQMLFDLILEDDNQAVPMRALIARLQLPMLRVALADATFFSDARHSARRFLNAISRAGIGWVRAEEKSKDRLYEVIESLVQRAGANFRGDSELFLRLRLELEEALDAEAATVRLAAERVIARERARVAAERRRLVMKQLIAHRIGLHSVPERLRVFLETDWLKVMLHAQGDPDAWRPAFAVLRRLTGSNSELQGSELLAAIARGLELISDSPTAARNAAAGVLALAAGTPARNRSPDEDDAGSEFEALEAAVPHAVDDPEAGRAADVSPDAVAAARALGINKWVELSTERDRVARCRLAAVTEQPERCIFVNRRGLRIDTLSRPDIARAIQAGRLRQLDDRQLFDRALEQVIGGLKASA